MWLDRQICTLLIMLVRGYQLTLSPGLARMPIYAVLLPVLHRCTATAWRDDGHMADRKRLMRCQPWCEEGYDPVPNNHPN